MPYLHESLAKSKALAEAPTLGNLHPDARAQALARAGIADAEAMRKRLEFLHSPASSNVDGYEWGIFRVKWENGRAVEVWQTNGDFSDLDAAMRSAAAQPTLPPDANDEDPHVMSALNAGIQRDASGVAEAGHQVIPPADTDAGKPTP
jgi:hypothetical protein